MEINPKKILRGDVYGFDLETTGLNPRTDKILVVSLSTRDNNYVWDYRKFSKSFWDVLFQELSEKLVIGHNIKFDMDFVQQHHGILFKNVWDTMVADQILYNGKKLDNGLYDVVERHLNVVIGNKEEKHKLQLSFVGMGNSELSPKQLKYASDDTSYLIGTWLSQRSLIYENELDKIMDLEMKLLPVLSKMEVGGCRIDRAAWSSTISEVWQKEKIRYEDLLDAEINKLSQNNKTLKRRFKPRNRHVSASLDIFGNVRTAIIVSDNCINYGSSSQILELFELVGEPAPTVIEKVKQPDGSFKEVIKETVGEGALDTYITEHPYTPLKEFIRLLVKYREYGKLCSTYGQEFLNKLDDNDYIHTTYTQTGTETGRLASKEPNLQNIPSMEDNELDDLLKRYGRNCDIRTFFLPDKGYKMITADMSSAEVRIAADFSGEPKLIASVVNGEDLHSNLASVSFSIIFGEPTTITNGKEDIKGYPAKALRTAHKSVLFAKFYKGGAKRIYEILSEWICKFNPPERHKQISQEISKAFDGELPLLSKYLSSLIDEAKKNGYLRSSKLGRIRYFDKETVYGDAANFPIQGINAEACKMAMIAIDKYLSDGNKGRIVMQVHDEVVCSVKPEFAEEAAKVIQSIMADSLSFFLTTISGGSTVEIADYWKK